MKSRKPIVALLIAICAVCLAGGVFVSGMARGPEGTDARAEIREALDAFFEASKHQDWDGAALVMSDDFLMFTDGAQVFPKDEYVRLLKADDLVMGRYELRDLEIGSSAAGDLGWVTYRGYFESTSHGVPSRVETAELLLFRNEGGDWRMFRAQASIRDLGSAGEQQQ